MTLGQNICRLRTERGLSQGDLADALGVSRQSISKWETDASVPELEKLRRLSELFHISLDALVGGEAAPEPPKPRAPLPETLFLAPLDPQQARKLRKAGVILLGIGLALPWLARWLALPALVLSFSALLGGLYLLLLSLPELPGGPAHPPERRKYPAAPRRHPHRLRDAGASLAPDPDRESLLLPLAALPSLRRPVADPPAPGVAALPLGLRLDGPGPLAAHPLALAPL